MLCADGWLNSSDVDPVSGLNPCFNGCYALIDTNFMSKLVVVMVLILVLMDVMR